MPFGVLGYDWVHGVDLLDNLVSHPRKYPVRSSPSVQAEKLALDWRKQQQTREAMQLAIETWQDKLPEAYEAPLWKEKVQQGHSYVYDNCYGAGKSAYASLALAVGSVK